MNRTLWRLVLLDSPALVSASAGAGAYALSRKDAALLALVALDGPLPSARAAGLVWPDSSERGALNNLRQRLHRLRRETGARLLEATDSVALAEDLGADFFPSMDALCADATAWDGLPLGAFDYADCADLDGWVQARCAHWRERRREALASIASQAEQRNEIARALVFAQRLLGDDPLSEHSHRRVMRLHYRRGDTACAVAAFESCERALKDELGLKPSAETIDLLRSIEQSTLRAPMGASSPMPAGLLRPPRAVGRDNERAQLTQAHEDGHIAALVGEAGMGKTRLLQDFIATRPQAVYAQARPGDASVPYGALARLLRAVVAATPAALDHASRSELARVAPELGEGAVADAPGQTGRLQRAIEQLLTAALECDVQTLVVDDLHFSDPASVEMLRALVDSDRLAGLRWMFAHRPIGASDENGALLESLADSPRARWIALAPLTDGDLVELLESLALPGLGAAALASALARHTGGNPLYVLETLREARAAPAVAGTSANLVLPRPQSIAHMIDRRLQRLSERALALGRVAALAGPDFSAELAEHALATPALLLAGAWAELEAADVLRGNAFAHDLVRDGMLRATPQPIAVHAHRLIAQFLDRHKAEPARLAPHWLAGGDAIQAASAYREAARRALAAGRPREQAELIERCAQALEQSGDLAAAVRARVEAVGPILQSDGVDAAIALTDRLLSQAPSPALAASVWSARALALMWAGRAVEAEQAAQSALALAAHDDDAVRVNALCMLAAVRSTQGDPQAAVALLKPWIARIDRVQDPELKISFFGNLTAMLMQADCPAEALPAAQRHLDLARLHQHAGEQVAALMNLSNLHGRRGDLDQAIAFGQDADTLIPESGQSAALLGWNRITLGFWLSGAGRFDEGLALLEASLEEFSRPGGSPLLLSLAQDLCARVWLTLGQPARAHRLVDAAVAAPAARLRARQLAMRAQVRHAMGQDDAALLEELRSLVPESEPVRIVAEIELAAREPVESAVLHLESLQRTAEAHEHFALAASAAARLLSALVQGGRLDEAATLVANAERASLLSRSPNVYLPESLLHCALAYRALEREVDAQRCLDAASHWVHAVALPHVPAAFIDGFLQRNTVNVRLRMAMSYPHRPD